MGRSRPRLFPRKHLGRPAAGAGRRLTGFGIGLAGAPLGVHRSGDGAGQLPEERPGLREAICPPRQRLLLPALVAPIFAAHGEGGTVAKMVEHLPEVRPDAAALVHWALKPLLLGPVRRRVESAVVEHPVHKLGFGAAVDDGRRRSVQKREREPRPGRPEDDSRARLSARGWITHARHKLYLLRVGRLHMADTLLGPVVQLFAHVGG